MLLCTQAPFGLLPLALVALVPLFLIPYYCRSYKEVTVATLFFVVPYVFFPVLSAILTFQWVSGFESFVLLAKCYFGLLAGIIFGYLLLVLLGCFFLVQRKEWTWQVGLLIVFSLLLLEYILAQALLGFNVFTTQYAFIDTFAYAPIQLTLGTYGVIAVVLMTNCAVALLGMRQKWVTMAGLAAGIVLIYGVSAYIQPSYSDTADLTVAILPHVDARGIARYGVEQDNSFVFEHLSSSLRQIDARPHEVQLIVYPGAPWEGYLLSGDSYIDQPNGASSALFQDWVDTYVPVGSTFVTWHIVYENGRFYNDVGYWQPGKAYQYYRKERMLPFSDYSPAWLYNIGVPVLPFNAEAATKNESVTFAGYHLDTLICSEVADSSVLAHDADLVLLVGSESFFSTDQASFFTLLEARKRSAISGKTIIRANSFAASAVISNRGMVVEKQQRGDREIFYSNVFLKN